MEACVDGKLDTIDLQFEDNACVCVVLASDGYPVKYEKGFPITGFDKFDGKEDYYPALKYLWCIILFYFYCFL